MAHPAPKIQFYTPKSVRILYLFWLNGSAFRPHHLYKRIHLAIVTVSHKRDSIRVIIIMNEKLNMYIKYAHKTIYFSFHIFFLFRSGSFSIFCCCCHRFRVDYERAAARAGQCKHCKCIEFFWTNQRMNDDDGDDKKKINNTVNNGTTGHALWIRWYVRNAYEFTMNKNGDGRRQRRWLWQMAMPTTRNDKWKTDMDRISRIYQV